jgi:hypothetical protein
MEVLKTVIENDKVTERRYTIFEVAEMLRVIPETVADEVKRGKLACYRIGGTGKRVGKLLFGASHVQDYLDRFETKVKATRAN